MTAESRLALPTTSTGLRLLGFVRMTSSLRHALLGHSTVEHARRHGPIGLTSRTQMRWRLVFPLDGGPAGRNALLRRIGRGKEGRTSMSKHTPGPWRGDTQTGVMDASDERVLDCPVVDNGRRKARKTTHPPDRRPARHAGGAGAGVGISWDGNTPNRAMCDLPMAPSPRPKERPNEPRKPSPPARSPAPSS